MVPQTIDRPWFLAGDFNTICSASEASSSDDAYSEDIEDLKQLLFHLELPDIKTIDLQDLSSSLTSRVSIHIVSGQWKMEKRQLQEGGSGSSAQGSKRRFLITLQSLEKRAGRTVARILQFISSGLVLFSQHVVDVVRISYEKVSEEVERVISPFHDPSLRAPSNPVGTSEISSLRLQFITKIPATVFTSSQIEAEDGTPLRIELVDGRTSERIRSGPLSSIKLRIVVLDGDFGLDEGEDWTEKEFNCNTVREREGKRPLITGVLNVTLQGGIGSLLNLIITDNSSWMRSRKFRLGAQAAQKISTETRIREARSEPFVVKDRRGELNKKHHPPLLSDEVWRLQNIAKDGALHKRMRSIEINTVQDFLQLHEVDASSLRNMLGTGIANRTWETIVRHASTCVVDDNKMYAYYQDSIKASILFNSVMKVTQATLDGQTYQSLDKLTYSQKILVQNLRRQAYHSKNQWVLLDSLPGITASSTLTDLPIESLIGVSPPLHHPDYTVLKQAIESYHCDNLGSDRGKQLGKEGCFVRL
ncbi:calmodulin-binding protein 60 B-like [Eucalyptus grandis]|uniref:calmodulin-binding protein 60 B-like n=1 Tax=Eucalyptus grandis TaxID=71139 RepID=UPI00192EADB8|nr:calmodulin-binding protein 60 B-like [Eucalyptus grandis]